MLLNIKQSLIPCRSCYWIMMRGLLPLESRSNYYDDILSTLCYYNHGPMKDYASLAELKREEKSHWKGRSETELVWLRWDLLQVRILMYFLGNQWEKSYQLCVVAFQWDWSYHNEVHSQPFSQKSLKMSQLRSPSASIIRLEPLEVMDSLSILVVLLYRQRWFLGALFTSLRPCLLFLPYDMQVLYNSSRHMLAEDIRLINSTVSQLCRLGLIYFLKKFARSAIGPFAYSPSYPQSLKKGFMIFAVISPLSSSSINIISSLILSISLSSFFRKLIALAISDIILQICSLLTTRVLMQLLRVCLGFSNTAYIQFIIEHRLLDWTV